MNLLLLVAMLIFTWERGVAESRRLTAWVVYSKMTLGFSFIVRSVFFNGDYTVGVNSA